MRKSAFASLALAALLLALAARPCRPAEAGSDSGGGSGATSSGAPGDSAAELAKKRQEIEDKIKKAEEEIKETEQKLNEMADEYRRQKEIGLDVTGMSAQLAAAQSQLIDAKESLAAIKTSFAGGSLNVSFEAMQASMQGTKDFMKQAGEVLKDNRERYEKASKEGHGGGGSAGEGTKTGKGLPAVPGVGPTDWTESGVYGGPAPVTEGKGGKAPPPGATGPPVPSPGGAGAPAPGQPRPPGGGGPGQPSPGQPAGVPGGPGAGGAAGWGAGARGPGSWLEGGAGSFLGQGGAPGHGGVPGAGGRFEGGPGASGGSGLPAVSGIQAEPGDDGGPIFRAAGPDPGQAKAYLDQAKAEVLARHGDYARAADLAMKAVVLDPANAEAHEVLAWSLLRLGRRKDALAWIDRAVRLDPARASSYRIRAFVKQMLNDRTGMILDLEKAAELEPAYRAELERARRGEQIYDPGGDDDVLLAAPKRSGKAAAIMKAGGFLLLAALLLGLLAGAGFRARSLLRTGPAAAPAGPEPLGGKYELGRCLGGRRGQVFEAKDLTLGRPVIVRRLEVRDPSEVLRLSTQARNAAAVGHAALAATYDIFEDKGFLCVVSELVAGRPARQVAAAEGRVHPAAAARILAPVCEAVAAGHKAGLSHGNVNLGNIFLDESGGPRLLDWGLAGLDASPARDVAALGRCLAELVGGVGPQAPAAAGDLIRRSAFNAEPVIRTAEEFLSGLKGL